jgi:SAM-dependent methyltransferase
LLEALQIFFLGVAAGWACLDLGCGPGGITDLLRARVGAGGRVVGLDADPVFLAQARTRAHAGVEFVRGDAYRTEFPSARFDLVHMRFVAGTAGAPEALLGEAMRLARPGGFVALQEPDIATLVCHPPHPAWAMLRTALDGAFAAVGADVRLGQRLFALARQAGLGDVQYRPFLVGVRAGGGLMSGPALDAALADCRAHLARPETVFTTYTVAQVWGRTVANIAAAPNPS